MEGVTVGGVTVDGIVEGIMDEDGKAGMPVLLGEALSVGMAVWLGLGTGMES